MVVKPGGGLPVELLDKVQRAKEPLYFERAVAAGDYRQDIADVAELYLYVVLVPEQVVDLYARKTHRPGMHRKLGLVERVERLAVAKLLAEGVIAADGVYLFSRIIRELHRFRVELPAVEREVLPRQVEGHHQQVACAGGLGEIDYLPDVVRVYSLPQEQYRALGEASSGFVHRYRSHVRAAAHGAGRKSIAKIEVRSVRFVNQHLHAVPVYYLDDLPQIGAYAVVGRVVDQHGFRVRICEDSRLDFLRGHSERYAEVVVDAGVHVDRYRSADHQRIDCAPVDVSRENYLIPRLAYRHHHRLNCSGGSVDDEDGVFRSEGVRSVLLSLLYDGNGVAEVVEGLHGVHVVPHARLAQEVPQRLVAAASLVPGDIKLDNAVKLIFLHCLVKRRTGVIKLHYAHLNRCSFR